MQRADDAVLRQIGQRFPDAVRQLLRRHGLLLFTDQREVDPALDVCAQQADVFQALRGSVLQQPIDLKELRLRSIASMSRFFSSISARWRFSSFSA